METTYEKTDDHTMTITTPSVKSVTMKQLNLQRAQAQLRKDNILRSATDQQAIIDDIDAQIAQATDLGVTE